MSELTEKTVAIRLESTVPMQVLDDQGRVIGSARLDGSVGLTILLDKHHPAALDLETENGLAKLKLAGRIFDNDVNGYITVGTR